MVFLGHNDKVLVIFIYLSNKTVKSLTPYVIEATILILAGCAKDEDAFIPRIPMVTTDLPFEFKRLQFPVRLTFVMSINKT